LMQISQNGSNSAISLLHNFVILSMRNPYYKFIINTSAKIKVYKNFGKTGTSPNT